MGLSSWDFAEYEDELFDDELIRKAIELLQKRYRRMANWIKNNKPQEKCDKCQSKDLKYRHDGVKCNNCGYLKKISVPYPTNGGVVGSRKLESVIKELFSAKMARKRKDEKPSERQINELPYELESFDTGEYTKSQMEYLKNRYERLIEENNIQNEVDKFYIRSLVVRELKIMELERRSVIKGDVDSVDIKRQYEVYNKLSEKVKADKSSRDDEKEQDFLSAMEDKLKDTDIHDILEEYEDTQKKVEEYRKKSKKRRESVGNPY
ncbi:MAG: hypothetical protein ACOC56_05615 [Atribacterota bacterium]